MAAQRCAGRSVLQGEELHFLSQFLPSLGCPFGSAEKKIMKAICDSQMRRNSTCQLRKQFSLSSHEGRKNGFVTSGSSIVNALRGTPDEVDDKRGTSEAAILGRKDSLGSSVIDGKVFRVSPPLLFLAGDEARQKCDFDRSS